MPITRAPYEGPRRKLVVAIDVGTIYSGVSYCVLHPGEIPEIRGVNRFPAQENVGGSLKIPTIIYYDQSGAIKAVGAEATREEIAVHADEWIKVEWFKVWLRPESTDSPLELHTIPPLPLNKTVVEVFGDFLGYIFECTKTYIQDTHSNGQTLWDSFGDDIHFVLTHPNGYEGPQQAIMRAAAVRGGLVPDDTAAEKRVSLVTEGEANLHYCIQSGLNAEAMKEGNGVMVVDCGYGTINFSSYAQNGDTFEEIAPAECLYAGSVFVTSRAHVFFSKLLQGTRFEDDVGLITERFDKKTKPAFRDQDEDYWIQFASMREKDPELGIRAGQLKVKGTDIASFFEPSITEMVYTIDDQNLLAEKPITSVFIVGDFAASDWLFYRVKEKLEDLGIDVSRPDSHVNKAVAHGAVSYYLDHRATTRVSKYTFGVRCGTPFDPSDPEHIERESTKYKLASGVWCIPNTFQAILPRKTQVAESKEFRRSFVRLSTQRESLRTISSRILCYRGETPKWIETEPVDKYTVMCTITVQLDELVNSLQPRVTRNDEGKDEEYYLVEYDIVLFVGLVEFKASVIWKHDGEERRSDAVKVDYVPDEPLSQSQVALIDVLENSAFPGDRDYVNMDSKSPRDYHYLAKLLNSEIFATATAIKNLFEGSKKVDYNETLDNWEFLGDCSDMAKGCIGDDLYRYNCQIETSMGLREQAVNPKDWIPLQLALQCILVGWCSYVVGISGPVPGGGETLKGGDETNRVREERSAFARWRAIIAGTTKKIECSSIDIAVTGLMAVLCISGLSSEGPDYRNVEKRVREAMENMEKLLENLKTSMHEGIVSGDVELITVDPGEAYNLSSMVDAHLEKVRARSPPRRSVLCTVGIGLKKTKMKVGKDVGYELLMPAEVALVDVLENFKTPEDPSYGS